MVQGEEEEKPCEPAPKRINISKYSLETGCYALAETHYAIPNKEFQDWQIEVGRIFHDAESV